MFGSAKLIAAQTRIQFLEEEVARLSKQNKELQETLISVVSPSVYQDMKAREPSPPLSEQEKQQIHIKEEEQDILQRYAQEVEAPLFSTPEDMRRFIGAVDPKLHESLEESATQPPDSGDSLHYNAES